MEVFREDWELVALDLLDLLDLVFCTCGMKERTLSSNTAGEVVEHWEKSGIRKQGEMKY